MDQMFSYSPHSTGEKGGTLTLARPCTFKLMKPNDLLNRTFRSYLFAGAGQRYNVGQHNIWHTHQCGENTRFLDWIFFGQSGQNYRRDRKTGQDSASIGTLEVAKDKPDSGPFRHAPSSLLRTCYAPAPANEPQTANRSLGRTRRFRLPLSNIFGLTRCLHAIRSAGKETLKNILPSVR
jgi:hypothetical protein